MEMTTDVVRFKEVRKNEGNDIMFPSDKDIDTNPKETVFSIDVNNISSHVIAASSKSIAFNLKQTEGKEANHQ